MFEDVAVLVLVPVHIPMLLGPLLNGPSSLTQVNAGDVQVDVHQLTFLDSLRVASCVDMLIVQTSLGARGLFI